MPSSTLSPATILKTALLLIDIQSGLTVSAGYYGTERSTPNLESTLTGLLSSIREHNTSSPDQIEIIHVHHHSIHPGSPLHPSKETMAPMPCAAPVDGEKVFTKNTNNAFIKTGLETYLREKRIRQLLVCGIATDHCVSTTVRMAADIDVIGSHGEEEGKGKGVIALIEDACAAFNGPKGRFDAETIHRVNLSSLEGEFCEIVDVGEVKRVVLGL